MATSIPSQTSTSAAEQTSPTLREKRLGGLFERKYRWGLSLPAKALLASLVASAVLGFFFGIYPFLAVTEKVNAQVLVVEGWVHPYAIKTAVEEFKKGGYEQVYTTGGPVVGKGRYINDWNTSASVGAEQLVKMGLPKEKVQMVPSRVMGRDRTYSSAVALQNWLQEHHRPMTNINIITEAAHARRTRLLFKEALDPGIDVGVIAVPSPDFNQRHWWSYSEGIEDVINESIGYLYAKLFFFPQRQHGAKSENSGV